jgi:hypothetical protein
LRVSSPDFKVWGQGLRVQDFNSRIQNVRVSAAVFGFEVGGLPSDRVAEKEDELLLVAGGRHGLPIEWS